MEQKDADMMASDTQRAYALGVLLIYLFFRLGLDPLWRQAPPLASYLFELAFVGLCALLYHKNWRRQWKGLSLIPRVEIPVFLASLLVGMAIYQLATFAQVPIPFNLESGQTLLALILIAPLLEELIFRLCLWEAVQNLAGNKIVTLITTSLLFSAAHFLALWYVPEAYRSFVLYQTLYVILLGLACGGMRLLKGGIVSAIVVHFGYNLGFYLGSTI